MRNAVIIGGLCVVVLAAGALLYWKSTQQSPGQQVTTGASADTQAPEQKEISFKVLDQGENAKGMPDRKNYAIYDSAEFASFWKKAHGSDGKAVPFVDFSKSYVIGVFAGTEPSGGYSISIAHVTEAGNARSVAVVIEEPGDTCTVIEEQTSPYQFVQVAFSDADALAHTDTRVKKNCPTPAL
jgi:hypothetical protein